MATVDSVFDRVDTQKGSGTLMEFTIREVEKYILRHRLGPGDRIPTERRMSELFGVSRSVVRDALKTLAGFGVIEMRERVGSFVASFGTAQLGRGIASRLFVNRESIESLLEVRHTLEVSTADWAARKCDDGDRARLAAILLENVSSVISEDVHGFRRSDRQLHIVIAEIARNEIVLDLLCSIFKYLGSFGVLVEGYGPFIAQCLDEHKRIVEAISRNDVAAARGAMETHLSSVRAHVLERVKYIGE